MNKDLKRLLIYLALSFCMTFLWFFIAVPRGETWNSMGTELQSFVSLGMMFPIIAHVLTRWITKEGFKLSGENSMRLGISFKNKKWIFYLIALILPWIYFEMAYAFSLLFIKEAFDPKAYEVMGISKEILCILPLDFIVLGAIGCFAGFGEEAGWRGYMMPKLFSLFKGKKIPALIVGGIIWGLWHAPLTCIGHNYGTEYPGFPILGILAMCLSCILIGIILTFITELSGSIWPAAILHAVNNTNPSILRIMMNPSKADPVKEMIATWGGLMISIAVFAVIFLIIWYNRNGAKRCAV